MNKEWHGLIKILEVEHLDAKGNILWQDKNLYNILHLSGEHFILSAVFTGGTTNTIIPTNYYFGLDNRTTLAASNTLSGSLSSEPSGFGYARIAVSSSSVFIVSLATSHYRAEGPIISFSSSGGSFGTVRNLFLATSLNNSGSLIASVALSQPITFADGDTVNMKLALGLRDC